jgi:5-methylcytosine-specific restriction endonuclease McrA
MTATLVRYASYVEYLQSPEWRARAREARRRFGHRCALCAAQRLPLEVHHNTYEHLGHERPEELVPLCEECHGKFHATLPTLMAEQLGLPFSAWVIVEDDAPLTRAA